MFINPFHFWKVIVELTALQMSSIVAFGIVVWLSTQLKHHFSKSISHVFLAGNYLSKSRDASVVPKRYFFVVVTDMKKGSRETFYSPFGDWRAIDYDENNSVKSESGIALGSLVVASFLAPGAGMIIIGNFMGLLNFLTLDSISSLPIYDFLLKNSNVVFSVSMISTIISVQIKTFIDSLYLDFY